jgi:hypothetical protein
LWLWRLFDQSGGSDDAGPLGQLRLLDYIDGIQLALALQFMVTGFA